MQRIPRLDSTLAAVALFASACGPSAPVAAPTQAAALAVTSADTAVAAPPGDGTVNIYQVRPRGRDRRFPIRQDR